MTFTIGVEYLSQEHREFEPIFKFDEIAENCFWADVGISEEELRNNMEAVQIQKKRIAALPGFPQLSALLYIDEGVLRFQGVEIEALKQECAHLRGHLTQISSKALVAALHRAAEKATERSGEVLIHPFG